MAWARLIEVAAGTILILAAASKVARIGAFTDALRGYRLVPEGRAATLAPLVIGVEGLVGAALLSQRAASWALLAAGCLFSTFAIVGLIEARSHEGAAPRSECGCLGGVVRLRIGRATIAMNAIVASSCLVSSAAFALTSDSLARVELQRVDAGLIWPAALLIAGLYWLASYAVSVIAAMDDTLGIPSPVDR